MGKIKTRLIKRTSNSLMKKGLDADVDETFEKNKQILGKEMPSKKVRNQIAGYIARIKKKEKEKAKKVQESVEAVSQKEE
jgi:small subunit ribosomal protein S17e